MTFLEYFNSDNRKINSGNSGSLSNDKRLHRHQRIKGGVPQITDPERKHKNLVPTYTIKSDDLVTTCRKTRKDQIINQAAAIMISKKYNQGDPTGIPTLETPEKGIKGTGVYMILDPNGRTYRLRYKGVQNGTA